MVDNKRIGSNVALGMVWYAVGQCFVGLRSAHWAKAIKVDRVTLFLDPLPESPENSMNLLRRISTETEIAVRWSETISATGVTLQIGNMGSFKTAEGEPEKSGKEHPHAVLVDWIVHSLYACFEGNQAGFLSKHTGRTEEELEEYLAAIMAPWFWLHEHKRDLLVPLNQLAAAGAAGIGSIQPNQV